jgi:hypothetical protein
MTGAPTENQHVRNQTRHRKVGKQTAEELKLLAYSVKDFCRAVGISSRMFYSLTAQGDGPTLTRIGRRTLITTVAADKWLASHQSRKEA